MKSKTERSPLDRASPMRVAGQSLSDELNDAVYDRLLAPLLIVIFAVVMAGLEW